MTGPVAVDDYELLARQRLTSMAYEYVAGGAADEITLRENRDAFARIRLKPRVLRDVTSIDTRITLFGDGYDAPILLAPIAYQKLFHEEGELAVVRGAAAGGAGYVVSTASNCAIEDIAAAAPARLWLQLYLQNDREVTRDLVARAEAAGCRAICLTVDTPVLGTRNRQARAGFALPADMPTPHLDAAGRERLSVVSPKREAVTWKHVEWLQSIARVPLLLKGILDPDDAALAAEHGAAGIIVSNHGARNLDTVPPTIEALPRIAQRVSLPLLLDSGIRRGTDIVKALALGASAVLVGRPYIYGLAVGGAEGVAHVVRILREELETAMALLGRASVGELDRGLLWD